MLDGAMLELLTLLLPIAAASGWYAASRHHGAKKSGLLRQAIGRTFEYPPNSPTDARTADEVSRLFKPGTDFGAKTLELQLALGSLFRRSGELSKAIELHEHLDSQPQLTDEQHHAVRFELGMDYLSAGLLDRAENVFAALAVSGTHGKASLQQMLTIYQSEKDWAKATECAKSLKAQGSGHRNATLAHLLCEQAQSAIALGKPDAALGYLQNALGEDPRCVRATLLKAQLALQQQRWAEAGDLLRSVEFQNPAFLPEIIDHLRFCHANLKDAETYMAYLDYIYRRYRTEAAALHLADELAQRDGDLAAANYLAGLLPERASLNLIRRTLRYADVVACEGTGSVPMLRSCLNALDGLALQKAGYACIQCGYECRELHWHCPTCRTWGTIQPAG